VFAVGEWVEAACGKTRFWGTVVRGALHKTGWCQIEPGRGQPFRGIKTVRAEALRKLSLLEVLALESVECPDKS